MLENKQHIASREFQTGHTFIGVFQAYESVVHIVTSNITRPHPSREAVAARKRLWRNGVSGGDAS